MSIVEILVLFAFIGVPLLQLVMRLLREGAKQQQQAPPPLRVPPLPVRRPTAPKLPVASAPKPAVTPARLVAAAVRRNMPRGPIAAGLRNPSELRRAIALTTILGPCTANKPYEGPASLR